MTQSVWILGAGLIGGGWAAVWASAGFKVVVIDPDERAEARLAALWPKAFTAIEALGCAGLRPDLPRVVATAAQAVALAPKPVWLQESLPEQLDLKRKVLAGLQSDLQADTIIASSSSGFTPDAISEGLGFEERMVIAHPCNPSYLMPVVELCAATAVPPDTLARARALLEAAGKSVLLLQRAMPGHLINRLQAALWREAVHLAREGVASVGDIERAVTLGLGPRWSLIGPSTVFHVSGGDAGMAGFLGALGGQFQTLWDDLGRPVLDAETKQVLIEGMRQADPRPVAEIAAERDAALARITAFLSVDKPK